MSRGPLRRVLAEPGTPYGRLALAGLFGLAAAVATIGLLAGSGYVVGRARCGPACPHSSASWPRSRCSPSCVVRCATPNASSATTRRSAP